MSREADQILNEMATLRREVDEDVDDLVLGAKEMTDWRYYMRKYPWVCIGGAVAIGYFAIPSRIEVMRPEADEIATLAKREKLVVEPKQQAKTRGGVRGQLFNFASSLVIRGLLAYAGQNVSKMLQPQDPAGPSPTNDE